MKNLKEMTNEELWEIFPIILKPHDSKWAVLYEKEKAKIQKVLKTDIARINHIGSSSVAGLISKPTIDILIELKEDVDLEMFRKTMRDMDYLESHFDKEPIMHILYLKGYTEKGFVGQAFHIHVHYLDDWNELYFRDYLRAHPEVCREYEKLKLSLLEKYEHHRDNYTNAKAEFIVHHTNLARKEFPGRYKK